MTAMPSLRSSGSMVCGFGWRGSGAGTVMPAAAAMIRRRVADSAGRSSRKMARHRRRGMAGRPTFGPSASSGRGGRWSSGRRAGVSAPSLTPSRDCVATGRPSAMAPGVRRSGSQTVGFRPASGRPLLTPIEGEVKGAASASPAISTSMATMRFSACRFSSIAKLPSIAASFDWARGVWGRCAGVWIDWAR